MKKVCILFFLMSLVELIPMIYNYSQGSALANEGNGLQYIITRLTIGNQAITKNTRISENTTLQNKLFNVIPDIVLSTMFFVFYFYWERKSYAEGRKIKKQIALPNDRAIEVKRLSG